jgi:hypothetical protein
MRELMDTMNRLSLLPADFSGKDKVSEWYKYFVIFSLKMIREKSGINQKVRERSGNLFGQGKLPLQQGT